MASLPPYDHLCLDSPMDTPPLIQSRIARRRRAGAGCAEFIQPTARPRCSQPRALILRHLSGRLRAKGQPEIRSDGVSEVVAGIGNFYSDEILFQARLHPRDALDLARRRPRASARSGRSRRYWKTRKRMAPYRATDRSSAELFF